MIFFNKCRNDSDTEQVSEKGWKENSLKQKSRFLAKAKKRDLRSSKYNYI